LLGTDVQIIFEANLMEYFDCVKASIHITLYIRYQKTVYITVNESSLIGFLRGTRPTENAYKSALYLAASIVEAAFELEWLYQTYIRNTDRKPVISDFRAVDKNIYVGLVPLRKPIRLDSFTVIYTVF
jgi:hypothetical protein